MWNQFLFNSITYLNLTNWIYRKERKTRKEKRNRWTSFSRIHFRLLTKELCAQSQMDSLHCNVYVLRCCISTHSICWKRRSKHIWNQVVFFFHYSADNLIDSSSKVPKNTLFHGAYLFGHNDVFLHWNLCKLRQILHTSLSAANDVFESFADHLPSPPVEDELSHNVTGMDLLRVATQSQERLFKCRLQLGCIFLHSLLHSLVLQTQL